MALGSSSGRTRPVAPKKSEAKHVERLKAALHDSKHPARLLVCESGEQVTIPRSVEKVLEFVVDEMAEGHAVTVVPAHQELTTQEAADMLNVSRPYLVGLLDEGAIPSHRVGSHRRVRVDDVAAYKDRRDAQRRRALRKLTRESQKLGLDY